VPKTAFLKKPCQKTAFKNKGARGAEALDDEAIDDEALEFSKSQKKIY
jgi:hypothetical protein